MSAFGDCFTVRRVAGLGCGCDDKSRFNGLGAINHNGFVTIGDLPPSTGTGGEIARDVGVGAFAFLAPILYDKTAPKKWPHTKKLWQDVAVVVGLYFLGTYVVRRVI